MAAQYNAIQQTINSNSAILFDASLPCNRGLVFHRDNNGIFLLASAISSKGRCCCGEWMMPATVYRVGFHATVQIPEGGAIAPISFGIAVDGEIDPSSIITITPAAVEEPDDINTQALVIIPAICGCGRVSVRNIGDNPVELLNGNIIFDLSGVRR